MGRSTMTAVAGGSRLRRTCAVAVLALISALAISLISTERASAYTNLFRPAFKPALADPCQKLGIGSKGGLVVRQWKPGKPSIKRFVALLCGPKVSPPAQSFYLVDDQIWKFFMHRGGNTRQHMLRGGVSSLPWNESISTKRYQFLKGPHGRAPAINLDILNPKEIAAIEKALEAILDVKLTFEVLECILGAIESEGASCLELLLNLAIEEALQVAKVGAIIIDAFINFIKSREAMAGADWFYWSDNYGFWNYFGDINPNWINPSITMTGLGRANTRIGVVFSNVAVDQGPNFNLSSRRARRDPKVARLVRFAARIRALRGEPLVGTPRNDILVGSKRRDAIHGRGRHDRILGRGGNDTILQGGTGRDRIFGGRGNDNIDGYRGRDRLFGGPGNDQIVDVFGPTVVRPGRGRDLVIVRDGKGDDVVLCTARSRGLIRIDRRDRIGRSCRKSPIRVQRGGRRVRIGRGY